MTSLTRRQSLGLLAAATIPPTAAVAVAPLIATTEPAPNREELEMYYAFLWLEFNALGQEMGCGMFNPDVMAKADGYRVYAERFKTSAPSSRALAVMKGARS